MIDVTIHDIEGRPIQTMRLRNVDEANANAGDGRFWEFGHADMATEMVDLVEGVIIARPALAALPASGVAPLTLDMALYPAGTVMTATNPEGDSVQSSDPADPITLTMAGVYRVMADPPWPWLPIEADVEVTNA